MYRTRQRVWSCCAPSADSTRDPRKCLPMTPWERSQTLGFAPVLTVDSGTTVDGQAELPVQRSELLSGQSQRAAVGGDVLDILERGQRVDRGPGRADEG